MADRWPWNRIRGFKVESQADGNILVTPDWIAPYRGPDEGGGPGLFSRMAMAEWIEDKLRRRQRPHRQGEKQP